jgi:hypothetical protein
MRLLLAQHPAPSAILTDVSLPDGNWCDVLRALIQSDVRAEVQVLARKASLAFRCEVAARGGRCVEDFETPVSDSWHELSYGLAPVALNAGLA